MSDLPVCECVVCGRELSAAASLTTTKAPEPGDVSVCVYCSNVAVYGDDLCLREPTEEEKEEIANLPETALYVKEVYRMHGGLQ